MRWYKTAAQSFKAGDRVRWKCGPPDDALYEVWDSDEKVPLVDAGDEGTVLRVRTIGGQSSITVQWDKNLKNRNGERWQPAGLYDARCVEPGGPKKEPLPGEIIRY